MAIVETIQLNDKVSAAALKAAKNVAKLEAALRKAQNAGDKAGAKSMRQELQLERIKERAAKGVLRRQEQQRKTQEKAAKQQESAFKKRISDAKQEDSLNNKAMGAVLGVVGAVVAIAAAATAATAEVIKLGIEFTKLTNDALDARRGAEGLFGALTGGRGKQALENVDRLGDQLGLSLGEAREQFDKFRSAGLNNKQTAQMMKLRADIVAVTGSAERGDEAMQKVLETAKSGGDVQAQMKALAKSAGTMGEGFDAAKKKSQTLSGALGQLKDAPARFFDQLAKSPKVAEGLDKLGQSINKTIEEFKKSPEAQRAMEMIESALVGVLRITAMLIPLVIPFLKGVMAAAEPIAAVIEPIGEAISEAFGDSDVVGMMEKAMFGLGVAVVIVAAAIGIVIGIAAGMIAIFMESVAMTVYVTQAFMKMATAVGEQVAEWYNAGVEAVQGLINGIKAKVGEAIQAAKDLAAKISGALKEALKIKSPSKLFEGYGKFTVAGYTKGVEKATPGAESAISDVAPAAVPSASSVPRPVTSSGGGFHLTLNVEAAPGATKDDGQNFAAGIVPVIRREIDSYMHGMAAQ